MTLASLTSADLVLLIVILLSALIGLVRGLVREVLSLAVWIAAFLVAMALAPALAEALPRGLGDTPIRLVAGFGLVFVTVLITGGILQWLIRKLVETTGLSGTDRLLGFVFGGLRGVLVCIVALVLLRPFAEDASWWQRAETVPALLAFEQDVLSLLGLAWDAVVEASQQI